MFDINNYTEKTKTVTITDPNKLFTIGDDFVGGQFVDAFSATGLVIKKDGVALVKGKNYTLPTTDKIIKEQYGQNVYSEIQMLGTTGTLVITYRAYTPYVSEEIVLMHESRLNEHYAAIDTVQNNLTNVESTVSGFDSRVTNVESAVEAAQSSIDNINTSLELAQSAISESQTDIDSLQANALLKTDNSLDTLSVSTPTDGAKFVYQDETTGAILTCSKSALTASSGIGSGDTISDVSTSTVDNFVVMSGSNGKHITDSGVPLSDMVISDNSTATIGNLPVFNDSTGKHITDSGIASSRLSYLTPGHIDWFDDYIDSSSTFPYLCLADDNKVLNASNWPMLVPYLREKKLRYMPGTALAQSAFNIEYYSIISNVATLITNLSGANLAIITALAEDNLVHGSFTNWRTITLPTAIGVISAGTYAISAINATNHTVSFAYSASNVVAAAVTATVEYYTHRLPTSEDPTGTQARHFQMAGRTLVSINDSDNECIAGLRRRDRLHGHRHSELRSGGTLLQLEARYGGGALSSISPVGGTSITIGDPITDGTNGNPRTGKTTDPRSLIAVPYICGGQYNA